MSDLPEPKEAKEPKDSEGSLFNTGASSVEDLSIEYTDNGVVTVKQLDKQVLSKGAWATLIFKYQDWVPSKDQYGEIKFTIRRYRKIDGAYKQQSKFNISSEEQAGKIIEILSHWVKPSVKSGV